jgi:ADP-ribose pyrophosphatase YjhB (NUDIX family)
MNRRRIGVRAIIYRDGKLLAVRHKNTDGSPKDFWAIPGGGLDLGESLEDGLRREIKEELGVAIEPGRLLLVQQFRSTRPDCDEELEFFFLVKDSEEFSVLDLMQTSHGADELESCEFIDPARERVLPHILSVVDLRQLVETIQPTLISNEL